MMGIGSAKGRWRLAVCIAAALASGPVAARPWWLPAGAVANHDFLAPDAAFRVSSRIVGRHLVIHWDIARGYYLYRSKMHVGTAGSDRLLAPPRFPPGVPLTDRYFGAQRVYYHYVDATAELARAVPPSRAPRLRLRYQGCAQAGLCYPPILKTIRPTAQADAVAAASRPARRR